MPAPIDDKQVKPIGLEVREKTFQQILQEQKDAANKPADDAAPTQTDEEKKAEEEKKEKEAEEAKKKEEEDRRAAETRQSELASKTAEEVIRKQEEEKQKEADRQRATEEAKKREEDLKPAWQKDPNAAKDEQGNPIPRSYDELQQESTRIAEEKAYMRLKAEQDKKDQEAAAAAQQKAQTEQQQQKQKEAAEAQLSKELEADVNDLYAANKLPKIKDPKDENDIGNKEYRNLFDTAVRVNTERMAKGLQPIRSLKLIYYEHYKPLAKPAGHTAPVIGNESTTSTEPPEDKYIVSRDRNKSFAQLAKEEATRIAKRMGVRGK